VGIIITPHGPADGVETFSIVCSMCDETIQVPETSRGQTVECPECGSSIETSSESTPSEFNVTKWVVSNVKKWVVPNVKKWIVPNGTKEFVSNVTKGLVSVVIIILFIALLIWLRETFFGDLGPWEGMSGPIK
jgi:predicted RNA-binding Zn-ribbon protein involved in translation (DUF1610 family)